MVDGAEGELAQLGHCEERIAGFEVELVRVVDGLHLFGFGAQCINNFFFVSVKKCDALCYNGRTPFSIAIYFYD